MKKLPHIIENEVKPYKEKINEKNDHNILGQTIQMARCGSLSAASYL
jgi:hypothetical protein